MNQDTKVSDILKFNAKFVAQGEYEAFRTDPFPNKRLVVITCMDTRLVELLPRAMNVRNGDVKMIKIAGAVVAHPYGSVMRSILIAVYQLKADEVAVIGHHGCGMIGASSSDILQRIRESGIPETRLQEVADAGVDIDRWLCGFDSVEESVRNSVEMVRRHPLFPRHVPVHGLIMHSETGKLDSVVDGYTLTRMAAAQPIGQSS
jgi:carbonic anhydrase